MFQHSSREPHGIRWWLHLGDRSCVRVEFYWWSPRCGVTLEFGDEGWQLSLRVPPLALYLTLEGFGLWRPQQQRVCGLSMGDWTVRLEPWSRWGEWRSADPWWVRGVSFDLKRLFGPRIGEKTDGPVYDVVVPMPEGVYPATVRTEHWVRGRKYWFKHRSTSYWLQVTAPGGIPHAGKGENSWDCGDDGLCGIGGNSVDNAVANAVGSVLRDRCRYGMPSPDAMRAAQPPMVLPSA